MIFRKSNNFLQLIFQTNSIKSHFSLRNVSSNIKVRVRFAPSPTGFLHLGGLRTALYNYLFAKSNNGKFIFRIEDTDASRTVQGSTESLEEDLNWASIFPDESPTLGGSLGPYVQSQRIELYREKSEIMIKKYLAYRCFCSLQRLSDLQQKHLPYDNKCRSLTLDEIRKLIEEGAPYCVRLKVQKDEVVGFNDLIFGDRSLSIPPGEGDFIIMKSTGFPTYHFASVVDDHLMQITHVLRGEDWISSLTKHLQLYKALDWCPPLFGHLPHLSNSDGTKLSKRQQGLHIRELQRRGFTPEAVLNFVKLSGGGFASDLDHEKLHSMEELISKFRLDRVNTHSAPIDLERLGNYNRLSLQAIISTKKGLVSACRGLREDVRKVFGNDVDIEISNTYLENILIWGQNRIFTVKDLTSLEFKFLWQHPRDLCADDFTQFNVDAKSIIEGAIKSIEDLDEFDNRSVISVFKKLQKTFSVKTPPFMKIIRSAVCGLKVGPPVAETLVLLGKETSLYRLKCAHQL